ncbi:DUF6928 family protein [Tenacibaculum agarivorans]|uniref:DUF6928 family protein n=1 Tax=Tenacibaculum agarivorans TaxID=1908389 RepID=UPI00094BB808|nr:hypothetical protein [Tenacibaculum agarivorans]
MGWKASMLIVNSNEQVEEIELLKKLGFHELTSIGSHFFEEVINPNEGEVYIGSFQGNLLICAQDLPTTFLNEIILKGEKTLTEAFPENTEICAIALHSVVNFWGYSISKNKVKLRVRGGSAESGTFIEYGEPLKEEKELLAKAKTIHGERLFHFDEVSDEYFTDDQVGENFVFEISKRYFNESIDTNSLLFDTKLKGFKFRKSSFNHPKNTKEVNKKSKWVKYLFIIIAVIIWQILKRTVFKG